MPVFVSKFGGSSLSDGRRFENVLKIVLSHPARRAIVVSAPGKREKGDQKITDLLITAFGNRDKSAFFAIKERFGEIARTLGADIKPDMDELETAVFTSDDAPFALSRGEWLTAKLFAGACGFPFLDAKDAVIFGGGDINEGLTKKALTGFFSERGAFVLPGFYGADESGRVRLFPRGGGDITGAVCAYCLKAERYENWTDVNGVFDRDPHVYRDAKPIPCLSYSDMERLSEEGAGVLHPDCIRWARRSGTPILVRSTFFPSGSGTLIGP